LVSRAKLLVADAVKSVGKVVYWAATFLAVLIAAIALTSSFYDLSEPIVPVVALLFGALVWLVGWFCKQLLAA
jgi:hypothetical protein